jgi:hypothetical protein
MGDIDPCKGACDGRFEVLGETPAAAEPCEGAFDDPASGETDEAVCGIGAFDDLEGPVAFALQGVFCSTRRL